LLLLDYLFYPSCLEGLGVPLRQRAHEPIDTANHSKYRKRDILFHILLTFMRGARIQIATILRK